MVKSESSTLSISIMVLVAGIAITTKMIKGIMVHKISKLDNPEYCVGVHSKDIEKLSLEELRAIKL